MFAINRALVFELLVSGGGHMEASKDFSLSLINKNSWATAAKSIYVDQEF